MNNRKQNSLPKGQSDKEKQESYHKKQLEKQNLLKQEFMQTQEIEKIKQIRSQQKNDKLFFQLQNEMCDHIKQKKDKLIKMKSFLKQLQIKIEQEEEQKYYHLQDQKNYKRPYTTTHARKGFQKDPEYLQNRLDNCKNQIKKTKQEISEESELSQNLEQESRQIFKINCSMKKKFEQSQDVEHIQSVKFSNLENFSLGILQKQLISQINLYRCKKEYQEMADSQNCGENQKRKFRSDLHKKVVQGQENISRFQLTKDDQQNQIDAQLITIKSIQNELIKKKAEMSQSSNIQNQVKSILLLKKIFISNEPYAFIQKLERDSKLIDQLLDQKSSDSEDNKKTIKQFFQDHTEDELKEIADKLYFIYQEMDQEQTSLKNKYLDQSQQFIKYKEKYEYCHQQLYEIIEKNKFVASINENKENQDIYDLTYFDFVSVDSGLIKNHQNNNLETINIMNINRQEQDSEIAKFTQVTSDQEYLLLTFYNNVQLLLKKFSQNFQIISNRLQDIQQTSEMVSSKLQQQDSMIQEFFQTSINNYISIEMMTINREEIDKKLQNINQSTRQKLIENSFYYSMLNPNSLQNFSKDFNYDVKIDETLGKIASLSFDQCQIKIKDILDFILDTHNVLKDLREQQSKQIKFISMYNQGTEQRKENIAETEKKGQELYHYLRKILDKIALRIEERKDQKNDQYEDQEIFKSTEIQTKSQDDYQNLKMLIDTKCIQQKDSDPISKYYKSQKKQKAQQDLQNKLQGENEIKKTEYDPSSKYYKKQQRVQQESQNKLQGEKIEEIKKTEYDYDYEFLNYQREQMKELIAETDRPQENLNQAVSKQLQMFKNENIKKMKQDLKYIQKIDKLYNLSKGQLEQDTVYLETQQDRKNIQKSIQQDSQIIEHEICTRISNIQTSASLSRKREIINQRQRIRDAQTQDQFYKSIHEQTGKGSRLQRKLKSAQCKPVPNINELKAYY